MGPLWLPVLPDLCPSWKDLPVLPLGLSIPTRSSLSPPQDLSIPTRSSLSPSKGWALSVLKTSQVTSGSGSLLPKGPAEDSTHPRWKPWLLKTQPPLGRLFSKGVTPKILPRFPLHPPLQPPLLSAGYLNLVDAGFGIPGGPLTPKPLHPSSEMEQVKTCTSYPHASDQFP